MELARNIKIDVIRLGEIMDDSYDLNCSRMIAAGREWLRRNPDKNPVIVWRNRRVIGPYVDVVKYFSNHGFRVVEVNEDAKLLVDVMLNNSIDPPTVLQIQICLDMVLGITPLGSAKDEAKRRIKKL